MTQRLRLADRTLKAELVKRDIGVAELAARIHKSRQYVGSVLNGRRAMTRDVAELIAMRTGIPLISIWPDGEREEAAV